LILLYDSGELGTLIVFQATKKVTHLFGKTSVNSLNSFNSDSVNKNFSAIEAIVSQLSII
jgi:hypothetical protein